MEQVVFSGTDITHAIAVEPDHDAVHDGRILADIIAEVQRQMRSLKRQVNAAIRHREYTEALRELEIRNFRKQRGIVATFKAVDTCAAEFEAFTPYYYSTYEDEDETPPKAPDKKRIMILGGGPNRIRVGQEHRALDHVLELADVAGPGVAAQQGLGLGGELAGLPTHALADALAEGAGQQQHTEPPERVRLVVGGADGGDEVAQKERRIAVALI